VREEERKLKERISPSLCLFQANDGLQALQMLNKQARKPDLVVSDIMMPRLDGLGLLAAMRASPTSELASIPGTGEHEDRKRQNEKER
jgi:CheY-like chemotaxis protein